MITSTSNSKVKNIGALLKKSKERTRQGVFLVEGPKMFWEIPRERIGQVFVSESFYAKNEARLAADKRYYEAEIVKDSVFDVMSDTKTPQGVIAVVKQFEYTLEDLLRENRKEIRNSGKDDAADTLREKCAGGEAPLLLLLEDLQDPGNLGTILRTAEGAGVTGIVMSEGCVDIYNPKVIRSTMGAALRMPFVYADDIRVTMEQLQRRGISVYAAYLSGSVEYTEPDYRSAAAFLIGNESRGLKRETAERADARVRIPMAGKVESLNAAVAASLLAYEAARQRRERQ